MKHSGVSLSTPPPLESVSPWWATIRWLIHLASQHIGHSRGKELIYADSQNSWHIKLLSGQGLDLSLGHSPCLARSVRAHFRRWKGTQSGPHWRCKAAWPISPVSLAAHTITTRSPIMYTTINFKTRKALVTALKEGQRITCFSPGLFPCPTNGSISLEGPHYPAPHKWYASGVMKDGILIKVK